MPRPARLVVPAVPHHIVQRGNRKGDIFFSDADRAMYVKLLRDRCDATGVVCLAWCLMRNHVHLILVPPQTDALRATLSPVHTRYAQRLNRVNGWTGHFFEGRFWSYPMGDAHLVAAVRYIENNPVKAGLVARAEEWPWSSARAHATGLADPLAAIERLAPLAPNWSAYLADGAGAAERDDAIEAAMRSGRPLGRVAVSRLAAG
jgi:putative transposase